MRKVKLHLTNPIILLTLKNLLNPMKPNVFIVAQLFTELLVTVGFLSSQMEVAMDGFNLITQLLEYQ